MSKLIIDFDEIQKAMEDISREAFDYFLDRTTGDVIILSVDIIHRAEKILSESIEDDMEEYDEIEFDQDRGVPDWMEEEIELALEIFLKAEENYIRIPERNSQAGFKAMKEFTETLEDGTLKEELIGIISDAEQILDEMNRFSDYIVTQMDIKSTEVSEVLKMIEEKQNSLRKAIPDTDYNVRKEIVRHAAKVTETKFEGIRSTGDVAQSHPPVSTRDNVIPINSRHKEILRMRETGMNETEIARQLRVGKGEVQLILELNK
jgi:DNA-binding NarL/FixJ family response regulator